nr:PPK2 family polyphosphate kinase [Umezawaea beigongshangensis]
MRVDPDSSDLAAVDPTAFPVGPTSKSAARDDLTTTGVELDELQERLYAEGVAGGGSRRVLLVLQGMDTSGKGGTIRHVAGLVNPHGLRVHSFSRPTPEELRHDFLWRVRREVPPPGFIGIFDRSHYEDVLVARVDSLVPEDVWRERYALINAFEAELAEEGTTVVKCLLHISPDAQRKRLLARLDDPHKHWKYDPADLDARGKWSRYQEAYADVLRECSSPAAPWYAVPSDRKWYRNWAVGRILLETLRELDPRYPSVSFDPIAEKGRLLHADPLG